MCQDALNGPSRLRETRRTSPLAHPTTSRPKPKAWVGRVAHGAPPPYMGPYGPRIYHRTTLSFLPNTMLTLRRKVNVAVLYSTVLSSLTHR